VAKQVDNYFSSFELSDTLRQWVQLSNDAFVKSVQIAQPAALAYLKNLSGAAVELDKNYRRSCQIPESECPEYCVCELHWDACSDDSVNGTIDIQNTGKNASRFVLNTEAFSSECSMSQVKPVVDPASFTLKPGESKRIMVSVQIDDSMEAENVYNSEIKVAGRYEQCVRLSINVRRRTQPCCKVEHGEIPTRIVAHHWYDHFQCEELCFEPVRHQDQPAKMTTNKRVAVKK
jgi:hypothetical protein